MMRRQGAWGAWKMLVMSLPKGIASFVAVVAGLAVSLPLSVFLVGLPLLAFTLVMCRRMMDGENRYVSAWMGSPPAAGVEEAGAASSGGGGLRSMLAVLAQGRSYRGIVYALLQLPVGIAAFTTAIVLPVTFFAILLSPLAYEVSARFYSFELFTDPWVMDKLLPNLLPSERSWVAGGAGALLVLLLPLMLRVLGRFYASWVQEIAAYAPHAAPYQPRYSAADAAGAAALPAMPAAAAPEALAVPANGQARRGEVDHAALIQAIEARLNV